jgi:hypothetical protein
VASRSTGPARRYNVVAWYVLDSGQLISSTAQGTRKLAACLVLRQMAENAPTIFFARTQKFFETIWSPLRDPKQQVREAAADALSAALAILKFRCVEQPKRFCDVNI